LSEISFVPVNALSLCITLEVREETRAGLLVGCHLLLSGLKESKRHKLLYNFRLPDIQSVQSSRDIASGQSVRQVDTQTETDVAKLTETL
jgi:hypothetical protein